MFKTNIKFNESFDYNYLNEYWRFLKWEKTKDRAPSPNPVLGTLN